MSDKREDRLIDADALFDVFENAKWFCNADRDIAEDLILDAHTIDNAPAITLNTLRDAIYDDSVAHGLWEGTDCIVKECIDAAIQEGEPADQEEMMRGLAMEFIRREVNEFEKASVNAEAYTDELADVIIAILSVAGKLCIDIDAAVRRKMEINKARPWKHGKEEQ